MDVINEQGRKNKSLDDLVIFTQDESIVNPFEVLLDGQSTHNKFKNQYLLVNVQMAKRPITIHCNAGKIKSDKETFMSFAKKTLHISTPMES